MKQPPVNERRFTAFRISTCGNQLKRGHIGGLTFTECREYPLGLQNDSAGGFTWGYALSTEIKERA